MELGSPDIPRAPEMKESSKLFEESRTESSHRIIEGEILLSQLAVDNITACPSSFNIENAFGTWIKQRRVHPSGHRSMHKGKGQIQAPGLLGMTCPTVGNKVSDMAIYERSGKITFD
ncbi:predicted protein [Coccidioides posadasii str. Silveira]|uniref:Predicted protein n=1 Tax=Coccidioides posadasii (strain RMSCC 757 / Silveira) TaxID=443226 RepID=E9DIZ4_COCPS|nr:predicted protein [Coccidioides posadasii str. Silveira]